MQRLVECIYITSAGLAGLFLVGVLGMVMAGILGRIFGFYLPGSDAYAGYCMAASGFLALAPTLRHGGHIRVEIVLQCLPERHRRTWERGCALVAFGMAVFLAFFSVRLAYQSYLFHDVSQGADATPLWIPQIGMALGSITLAVAFLDLFIAPFVKRSETVEALDGSVIVD